MKSNIKFTFDQSTEEVNFLDVCVKINSGVISTTVFSKPTDSHLYLNSNSNHPRHVIRNISKSQFLRLRRICSNHSDFVAKSSTYAQYFISRGYDKTMVEDAIREVTKLKREDLLADADPPNEKTTTKMIVFTCDWHEFSSITYHPLSNGAFSVWKRPKFKPCFSRTTCGRVPSATNDPERNCPNGSPKSKNKIWPYINVILW